DLLRPDSLTSYRTLAHSRASWRALRAAGQLARQLPSSCIEIRALLNNTPSIPRATDVGDIAEGGELILEGCSQWSIAPYRSTDRKCDLNATKECLPLPVYIGVSRPGTCELSDEYVPKWPGFQSFPRSSGNFLCLCVLGWSYIFSARLVELRGITPEDNIAYSSNTTELVTVDDKSSTNGFDLEVDDIESDEARWWAAILATGSGWHATLIRKNEIHYSPWECHLAQSPFRLCTGPGVPLSSLQDSKPPSSAEAQKYLLKFARSRHCFDQLIAAFVVTLTIPSHSRFGASVILPKPAQDNVMSPDQGVEMAFADKLPTPEEIPHFMALSCISNAISSSLSGCFFEPGIPCNLASEWLNPPLKDILPSLLKQKRYHDIICTVSYRRPIIAPLWLGAVISGLAPRIFLVCRSYLPPISLEAAVWTKSPQSFIDPKHHRRAKVLNGIGDEKRISREDEYRLLYLTDTKSETYRSPPLSPYPPFGSVKLEETSIEVRLHAQCDHRLRYVSWIWKGTSGKGFKEALLDESLSESATRNVFCWTLFSDGTKLEERGLWDHEWLNFLL
ncbi:hypothetical protein BP00DRAFT_301121, partial [Aspergillus indologenus CBS 114.80]